jgi:hypothetical protein
MTTENESWGFFGTIGNHTDAKTAWREASVQLVAATGCSGAGVRDFLDSRHGRHFADDVANGLFAGEPIFRATTVAIGLWHNWKIGRHIQREEGIPAGLPYLMGWVAHFEMMAAAA